MCIQPKSCISAFLGLEMQEGNTILDPINLRFWLSKGPQSKRAHGLPQHSCSSCAAIMPLGLSVIYDGEAGTGHTIAQVQAALARAQLPDGRRLGTRLMALANLHGN